MSNAYQHLPRYPAAAGATQQWLIAIDWKFEDGTRRRVEPADVDSLRFDLYELNGSIKTPVNDSGAEIGDGTAYDSPAVASVVYADWQDWGQDSRGHNSEYRFAPPLPDRTYYGRMTITLVNAEVIVVAALWITH